jgi:transcription antitermination factor NusB
MGKRRRAREAALKLLYALEITRAEVGDVLAAPWAMDVVPEVARDFARELVCGVTAHREAIDALIQASSLHWSLERIGLVERNILRFAIYELLYMPDIPPRVTINEAVEIAKKYGAEEASVFVNGILDHITHEAVQGPACVQPALPCPPSSPC